MNKEKIRKIGEYLNYKYIIARDVNGNDKLEIQDRYIQQLYDAYLDLKIKHNDLLSQLDIANNKLNKIDTFIRGHQLFGMRFAKTLYRECLEHILSIIGSD